MNKIKSYWIFRILFILIWYSAAWPYVYYLPKPLFSNPWQSDSVYVGVGVVAKDSNVPVRASWIKTVYSTKLDQLCYMHPSFPDSQVFLFYNLMGSFPDLPKEKEIGIFPAGTPIYFVYSVIDSSMMELYNKKLFSDQNRPSIDPYISEVINGYYKYCWAAGGQLNDSTVEMGFSDDFTPFFFSIIFHISGAKMIGVKQYKLAFPRTNVPSGTISQLTNISLTVPSGGSIAECSGRPTVRPLDNGEILRIYYTTDGSDPRTSGTKFLYTDSIPISQTTTLKAYAFFENDTNWFPSEVMTATYTYDGTSILPQPRQKINAILNQPFINAAIYDNKGRLLTRLYNLATITNAIFFYTTSLPNGIYYLALKKPDGSLFTHKLFIFR